LLAEVVSPVVMRLVLLLALALVLTGCGGEPSPKPAPEVRGQRLDIAEERLDARGLDWEEIGGGNLGIVVRSHWYVCSQEPRPGKKATTVRLVVDRNCATFDFLLPNVEGMSLEDAEEELEQLGIPFEVESREEDTPRVEHLWEVCYQSPPAGQRATSLRLYVRRFDCD